MSTTQEGWKVVPVEPTWEMRAAAKRASHELGQPLATIHERVYAAMLVAAPHSPSVPVCVCGEPLTLRTVHRADGPYHQAEPPPPVPCDEREGVVTMLWHAYNCGRTCAPAVTVQEVERDFNERVLRRNFNA